MKNFEELEQNQFIFPSVSDEIGEIERVADIFSDPDEDTKSFIERFMNIAERSILVPLTDDLWSVLENTDSFDTEEGDFDSIKKNTLDENPESPRDWEDLKRKIDGNISVDAPIILEKSGRFHLVSGNTRLMVSRALGKQPYVLIVKMD